MAAPVQWGTVHEASSPAARTSTFSSPVASGNTVLAFINSPGGQALPDSVATDEADTLTLVAEVAATAELNRRISVYAAYNVTSGAESVVATWPGNGNRTLQAVETTPLVGGSDFTAEYVGGNSGGEWTPAYADEGTDALHLLCIAQGTLRTWTPASGTAVVGNANATLEMFWKTATGSGTMNMTPSSITNYDGLMVSFDGGSAGTAIAPLAIHLRNQMQG